MLENTCAENVLGEHSVLSCSRRHLCTASYLAFCCSLECIEKRVDDILTKSPKLMFEAGVTQHFV